MPKAHSSYKLSAVYFFSPCKLAVRLAAIEERTSSDFSSLAYAIAYDLTATNENSWDSYLPPSPCLSLLVSSLIVSLQRAWCAERWRPNWRMWTTAFAYAKKKPTKKHEKRTEAKKIQRWSWAEAETVPILSHTLVYRWDVKHFMHRLRLNGSLYFRSYTLSLSRRVFFYHAQASQYLANFTYEVRTKATAKRAGKLNFVRYWKGKERHCSLCSTTK